jgi:hypothetical protein
MCGFTSNSKASSRRTDTTTASVVLAAAAMAAAATSAVVKASLYGLSQLCMANPTAIIAGIANMHLGLYPDY